MQKYTINMRSAMDATEEDVNRYVILENQISEGEKEEIRNHVSINVKEIGSLLDDLRPSSEPSRNKRR